MTTAMICLVSEQSLPNYLGIKKFLPDQLHLLYSDENKFLFIMENLGRQSVLLKEHMGITTHVVKPHDVNDVQEKSMAIIRSLKESGVQQILLNATGGTKPMSFGLLTAGLIHRLPVYYVSMEENRFVELTQTLQHPGNTVVGENNTLVDLKVAEFLGLNGIEVVEERTAMVNEHLQEWEKLIDHALTHPLEWQQTVRYLQNGKRKFLKPSSGKVAAPLTFKDSQQTLHQFHPESLRWLQQVAVINRMKVTGNQLTYCLSDHPAHDFLLAVGTPLEVLVYQVLKQLEWIDDVGIGITLRWKNQGNQEDVTNELDILASSNARLWCVSCKAGKVLTPHLNELDQYARRLGGTYTKKILVSTQESKISQDILKRAANMDIHLLRISGRDDLRRQLTKSEGIKL